MGLISKQKFTGYQRRFYGKVTKSPMVVELKIVTSIIPEDEYEAFTGDSDRITTSYKVPCLYKREIKDEDRSKYGWSQDVDGVLYFSPIDLVRIVGTFKIDTEKTTIIFADKEHKIEQREYLEPYYDSCVGLRIAVSNLRGSDPNDPIPEVLLPATITFTQPGAANLTNGHYTPSITSTSSAPLILISSDPLKASVTKVNNVFQITLHTFGTVMLTAMQLKGNGYTAATPVTRNLVIEAAAIYPYQYPLSYN